MFVTAAGALAAGLLIFTRWDRGVARRPATGLELPVPPHHQ
jgi:hypothetical protein